ncbi:MAG: hypothetical protein R3Y28_05630 [Candidatus Gastranaerophilales bacterium]
MNKNKIYDCFTFYNELDLLEIRLNTLNDIVDKFILVEMNKTHAGNDKEFIFENNKQRFSKFLDKIIHIKIENPPELLEKYKNERNLNWFFENYQRNAIDKGLINCKDDDTIMISDLDEIPNPKKVLEVKDLPNIKALDMIVFNFSLNNLSYAQPWVHGTKVMSYKDYLHILDDIEYEHNAVLKDINSGTTASKIRLYYGNKQLHMKNAGWHFSYIGNEEHVINKCKSIVEGVAENSSDEKIIKIYNSKKFLEWDLIPVIIDDSFPEYLINNQDKYAHLIIKNAKNNATNEIEKSLEIIYNDKFKLFKKVKDLHTGRRRIYFCGVKIASYKKSNNKGND